MFRKSFYLTAVLCATLFIGCQPDPTPISSTEHRDEKPKTAGDHSGMNHNGAVKTEGTDHSSMNHSEHSEMKSSPDAAAQAYDLQFLDTMIHHHEGAVEMSKAVSAKGENAELKTLAAKIIVDQEKEIAQMKKWRETWFAGKPSAMNMEMAGMKDSMKGMDIAKLNAASGKAFDIEFINQMIPHHEGAVVMAREAATKAEHAELKTLANQIIAAQDAEIKTMQDWKTKWAK